MDPSNSNDTPDPNAANTKTVIEKEDEINKDAGTGIDGGASLNVAKDEEEFMDKDLQIVVPPSSLPTSNKLGRWQTVAISNQESPSCLSSPRQLTDAVLLQYKMEKRLIHMLNCPLPSLFPNYKASLWCTVLHIDWPRTHESISALDDEQIHQNKGLVCICKFLDQATEKEVKTGQYHSLAKRLVICPLCKGNATRSLNDSLITCGHGSSSNIGQHHKMLHPDEPNPSTSGLGHLLSLASLQFVSRLQHAKAVSTSTACSLLQTAIYKCIKDLVFPTNNSEKKPFRELLTTILDNATFVKEKDFSVSSKAITQMLIHSYNSFIKIVSTLGFCVRQHYKKLCGKEVRFGTICHDIWQGIKKEILGVSLMLCNPRNCVIYKIPLGLLPSEGHSAAKVSAATLKTMSAYRFLQNNLCASVNNNTGGAVLASKYIPGLEHGGKCNMHCAKLILKHATGLAICMKNKIVIDSNQSSTKIYQKFFTFTSWLMSKQACSRFIKYRKASKQHNIHVIEIPMPNTTRVSGCMIMFQALLGSKWAMDNYASRAIGGDKEFKKHYPSEDEWVQLSEFEGILCPLQTCSMSLQSDDPASNSASVLQIYISCFHIEDIRKADIPILPVKAEVYPNGKMWDAGTTMAQLELKKKTVRYCDLLQPSRILIKRLQNKYTAYILQKKDWEAELAMCANTLMAGFIENFLQFL